MKQKASTDYKNDFRKVIDVVRGTIEFKSIEGMKQAIMTLLEGGDDVPKVVRGKDRLDPGINGLRDVLLNLIIPNTGGLVVELQLHFKDLHAIKPMAHRIYGIFRTVGWVSRGVGFQNCHNVYVANRDSIKFYKIISKCK